MLRLLYILVFYLVSTNVGSNYAVCINNGHIPSLDICPQQCTYFKIQLDSIEEKLTTLQDTINKHFTTDDSPSLLWDIRESIKDRRFETAEAKLNNLHDKNHITKIVQELCAESAANTDYILSFARSLSDSDVQLRVSEALLDVVVSSKKAHSWKLIELIGVQKRALSRQNDPTTETKLRSERLIASAEEQIYTSALTILKTAMIDDNYQGNEDIMSLASHIYNFSPDLWKKVIEGVVDSTFRVVAAGKIIDNVSSHTQIPVVIEGLKTIFYKLKYAGNLNNVASFHMAMVIRNLRQRSAYEDVSRDLKDDVVKIIEQLPTCARNFVFPKKVCFWNEDLGKHMDVSGSVSNRKLCHIFTHQMDPISKGPMWGMQKTDEGFSFKSKLKDKYFKDSRHVFTWNSGEDQNENIQWGIELDGDYCYVRSVAKQNMMNSYAFPWILNPLVTRPEFQWQLTDCDSPIETEYDNLDEFESGELWK